MINNSYLDKYKSFQFYSRQILNPFFKNPKCNFLYLVTKNLGKIVGEKYKEYCKVEKVNLINENRQGNIYLISFNSSVSFYLNNNKHFIIEKINAIFGYNAVGNLFIKEVPTIVRKKVEKTEKIIDEEKIKFINAVVENVENKDLKKALIDLGNDIFGCY